MTDGQLDKLLSKLRERLKHEPSLHDQFTGELTVPVYKGSLSGNIKLICVNIPPQSERNRDGLQGKR